MYNTLNQPIYIIVLNWNNASDTVSCLESLERSDKVPYKPVVVDNGSGDESAQIIRARYPNVDMIENTHNLGYAAGNNVGIRYALQAGAEWILLLNNDVIVAADFLTELVYAAQDLSEVGALGPLVYHSDSQDEIQAAGGFFLNGFEYRWQRTGELDTGQFDGKLYSVDLLPGCALLLSREVLEKVGLLDERFFMYREDIDLCLRVAAADYGLYLVPAAHVWHRRPGVQKSVPPYIVYYMARNSLLLARKHRRPLQALRFLWQDLTAWTLWKVSPRWKGMEQQAAARADGVKDFFLGRFGRSDRWTPKRTEA